MPPYFQSQQVGFQPPMMTVSSMLRPSPIIPANDSLLPLTGSYAAPIYAAPISSLSSLAAAAEYSSSEQVAELRRRNVGFIHHTCMEPQA
jgi:hypothetical protein